MNPKTGTRFGSAVHVQVYRGDYSGMLVITKPMLCRCFGVQNLSTRRGDDQRTAFGPAAETPSRSPLDPL
eukprot:3083649-Pyramimonas_sp.AAC.1